MTKTATEYREALAAKFAAGFSPQNTFLVYRSEFHPNKWVKESDLDEFLQELEDVIYRMNVAVCCGNEEFPLDDEEKAKVLAAAEKGDWIGPCCERCGYTVGPEQFDNGYDEYRIRSDFAEANYIKPPTKDELAKRWEARLATASQREAKVLRTCIRELAELK